MPERHDDPPLQLSRDLSRLNQERLRRLTDIDQAAHEVLRRLPGARAAVERFEQARASAAQAYEQTSRDADTAYAAAGRAATNARADDLADVQQKYIAAGRAADDERRTALMKADAVYKERLDEIARTIGLDRQAAAREAALEAHRKACAAIETAARERLQKNRDAQQGGLQSALDREREAAGRSATARDGRLLAAEQARDAVLRAAEDALTRALLDIPGAADVQTRRDEQRRSAEEAYRTAEQQLFAAFRARRPPPVTGVT